MSLRYHLDVCYFYVTYVLLICYLDVTYMAVYMLLIC